MFSNKKVVWLFLMIIVFSSNLLEAQGFWGKFRGDRNKTETDTAEALKTQVTPEASVEPAVDREQSVPRPIPQPVIDEAIEQDMKTIPPEIDPEDIGEDMMTDELSRSELAEWLRGILINRSDLRARMQGVEVEGEGDDAIVRYNGIVVDESMSKQELSILWREVQDIVNALNTEIMHRQQMQIMQQVRQSQQVQQQARHVQQAQQAQSVARQVQQAQQAQSAARQAQTGPPTVFQPPRVHSSPPPTPPPGPPRR
ncbi:MAG: hypothetical protein WCV56_07275 [Candidatus Omnitrophota bacterium]